MDEVRRFRWERKNSTGGEIRIKERRKLRLGVESILTWSRRCHSGNILERKVWKPVLGLFCHTKGTDYRPFLL